MVRVASHALIQRQFTTWFQRNALARAHSALHTGRVHQPDIRGLQTGDGWTWEMAFHWLWPVAWTTAERRLGYSYNADVEDIAISAIRECAEKVKAGQVVSFEQLKALTGVIAYRRALDHVRRMQAQRRATGATDTLEGRETLALSRGPLEELDARELAQHLVELSDKLSERQRELLIGYYLRGEKQAELAARLDIPIGTVGVTLTRALTSLRKELRKRPGLMKELQEILR